MSLCRQRPEFWAGDTETLRPNLPITQKKSDCIPQSAPARRRIGCKKEPRRIGPGRVEEGETSALRTKKAGSGAGPFRVRPVTDGLAVAAHTSSQQEADDHRGVRRVESQYASQARVTARTGMPHWQLLAPKMRFEIFAPDLCLAVGRLGICGGDARRHGVSRLDVAGWRAAIGQRGRLG